MSGAERPRWGSSGRERKAQALLCCLRSSTGRDVGTGLWLDIGCGSGGIAAALAPHVERIVGVDPEPWPEWPRLAEVRPNLSFRQSRFDADAGDLADGRAAVVVCNQVYEHVEDPQQLLRNLHAALRPGGICYFAGPNLLWPVEPHVYWPFVHWLPRHFARRWMRRLGSRQADSLDAHSVSYWTLARWFREAGFAFRPALRERLAAELQLRDFPRAAGLAARLPRWLLALLMPFTPGFVFVLEKR